MVKCVVSSCPNRMVAVNRGVFNRPRKRFFHFPKDPARVKVWLAALRETDQKDSTEQHFICEDHFLPEDISTNKINRDAIPIMPAYLDGPLGLGSPWTAESSSSSSEDEDDEEEEEEEDDDDGEEEEEEEKEEDSDEESGDDAPPAPAPPQQNPGPRLQNRPEAERTSFSLPQMKPPHQPQGVCKQVPPAADGSLRGLTLRFLKLMLTAPDGAVDIREAAANLQTHKWRVYDITHVLDGFNLVRRESTNLVKWIAKTPISSFLWNNQQMFQEEVERLKVVEDQLDGLIKSCSRELFNMTDNLGSSAFAYVTHKDLSRLPSVQQQTLVVIRSPEETKLEIPPPQEDGIQVHLKAEKGPIKVVTCEMGSGDAATSDLGFFSRLEASRIRTSTLHTAT